MLLCSYQRLCQTWTLRKTSDVIPASTDSKTVLLSKLLQIFQCACFSSSVFSITDCKKLRKYWFSAPLTLPVEGEQHCWVMRGSRLCHMWSFVQHSRTLWFSFHVFVAIDSWFWSDVSVKTSVETFAGIKLPGPCLNYSIRCWNNILSVFWFGVLQGWLSYIPDDDLSICYKGLRVEFF